MNPLDSTTNQTYLPMRLLALSMVLLLSLSACIEDEEPSSENNVPTGDPEISLSPLAIYFEDLDPGQEKQETIIISNVGGGNLLIDTMRVISQGGHDSTAFYVDQLEGVDRRIRAGESQPIQVYFRPEALGYYAGLLVIENSDPHQGSLTVRLSTDDPVEDCQSACSRIYDECDLHIVNHLHESLGRSACETRCMESDGFHGKTPCLQEITCSENPVLQCIPDFAPEMVPIPEGECEGLDGWTDDQRQVEEEVVHLVNEARARGANCGDQGVFPAAEPIVMEQVLRCAARRHSKDMVDRNYFDHVSPTGEDPFDRISTEGYGGSMPQGENIAAGYTTAEDVVNGWLQSPGHCSNIMEPGFRELGVGMYQNYWTQKFGGG